MPRESQAWSVAREHLAPFGVLHRVENAVVTGYPDVTYCLLGVTGMIESKATAASLTLEQVLFAETWKAAGGLCHTLLRADRRWFLLDAAGRRRLFERRDPEPLVSTSGAFPLKDMLLHLAPPSRRFTFSAG